MRAVAILFVVLGHANTIGFSGGFIGVDVFFVISGFLITRLLKRELESTGHIDFWGFYARRIRRLMPAFFVFTLTTVFALAVWPWGLDANIQTKSAVSAALWCSNVLFSLGDLSYFSASSRDSVFLHTWSLAVEEQFYLVWPAALWLASRRTRAGRSPSRWLVVFVAIFGLCASIVGTWITPVSAYFMTPFRLWELATGGMCSYIVDDLPKLPLRVTRWVTRFAVAILAAGCVLISEQAQYPGFLALVPVVGASLLIVFGEMDGATSTWHLLRSTPMRFVGRISYGWYLWHWPVLVLAKKVRGNSLSVMATGITVSFLLACLSYRWIEAPLRRRAIDSPRMVVLVGVFGSAVLALVAAFVRPLSLTSTGRDGTTVSRLQLVRSQITAPLIYSIEGCDEWYFGDRLVPCVFGSSTSGARKAIVLGDSVGLQWFPALHRIFSVKGWKLVVLTKSSCPIVDEPIFYERIRRRYTECESWRAAATAYVQAEKPDLLIVGSAGTYDFSRTQWIEGARRELKALKSGAEEIIILAPTPRLGFDAPTCVAENFDRSEKIERNCSAQVAKVESREVIESLEEATQFLPSTVLLNLNGVACPGGLCRAWIHDRLTFRDDQHLNATYVESLTPEIAAKLEPFIQAATDQN